MRKAALLLWLFAAPGCNSSSPTSPGALDTQVTLAPGQSASLPQASVRIRFVEVISDSRCPINVMCVRAGEAVVRLELARGNRREEHDVQTGVAKPVQSLDLTVRLVELTPYPVSGKPTEPSEYRGTFRVTR